MIDALTRYEFLQNAVAAVLLGAAACGIVGSLLFVNRLSSLAGGISHTVFGGLGFSLLARVHPLIGAASASLIASLALGWMSARKRERADAAVAAVWSVGMSLGLVFVSLAPGYKGDLMGYLFGSVLAITREDLALTALVSLASAVFLAFQYRRILAVSFDPEFSRARGISSGLLFGAFLCLTGLTVVVLMRSVGLVMVIALLSIPPATARMLTHRLPGMVVLSSVISALSGLAGIAVSWWLDLPAGASIVLCAGALFALVTASVRLLRSTAPVG
ncbi:metal ABC transporter permease [Candidatus Fermentibacteria bacterium]|nr:metal ABC transporter permease [Candidatus Fermentibacteria bacterium]